jgi:alpha/beta hydrolase family protein
METWTSKRGGARRLLAAAVVAASILPGVAAHASTPQDGAAEPTPAVQGPITGGTHGRAFNTWPWSLNEYGYDQAEYFISGTAKAYGTNERPAPYKVRIQVMRPIDPRRASGAAIVEWSNVTAQYEIPLGWVWSHPYVMTSGDVYVMVGAQEVGVCDNKSPDPKLEVCSPTSLKGWDPARYSSLHHPGDDYSFDIYSQAIQAILHPRRTNPVAGLVIRHVIGYGQSQSGTRFDSYLCNGADGAARLIDSAIIDADIGTTLSCRPRAPTLKLWSEDSARPSSSTYGPNLRIWMIPGASHEDAWQSKYEEAWTNYNDLGRPPSIPGNREMQADAGNYGQEGLPAAAETATCLPNGDAYPRRYVDDAAVQALKDWMVSGKPAPIFPSISFASATAPAASSANFNHDQFFNTLGGLRSPVLDVPVATYIGPTCGLFGETAAFTPVQLRQLYPTQRFYVDKMYESIQTAVRNGALITADATDLMDRACASMIGNRPVAADCPTIRADSPYREGLRS